MKNVVKFCFIAIMVIGMTFNLSAQRGGHKEKGPKLDKLIKKLDLSESEASDVKQILSAHFEENKARMEALRANRPSKEKMKELSDSEIEKLIETKFNAEQAHLDSKRQLLNDLKKVLPMKKVAKVHLALERQKRKKGRKHFKGHRNVREMAKDQKEN